ncbi:MAG: cyclophane-forming radical SAM peptide maturase AmcB [Pseudonocardiaceae bacterium]
MQPSTLCNLDCSYCYLPARRHNLRMMPTVASAVARSVEPWAQGATIDICWHGGEPLTAGRDHLSLLMDAFDGIRVTHSMQTNASLIDERWIEFLMERRVRVGVSIDGPVDDNDHRIDRAGRPSFDRVLHGLRLLIEAGQGVAIIAVVSDPSPLRARRLYKFVRELGAAWLGVNIEEREGINRRRTAPAAADVIGFWSELAAVWQEDPIVRVREIERVIGYAGHVLSGGFNGTASLIDPLPTVAWNGDVTLISPELAGFHSRRLGNFSCGNVLEAPLESLIADGLRKRWVAEFQVGIEKCRASCGYFEFCGGGQPGNRYFEQGRLDGTETDYCRNSKIALIEGVLENVGNSTAADSSAS